ncbi:MAG: c-type cytochrome biogenesis protein CcmI [Sutterellaceae bacterium]|nr:c-type cytochrome biogenesis protein CcmI [Burkholderiaceae bacterium]MCX7901497.1 c-type cytochrome biogenesis protein CcmI [Burkholderiaceae bacterium]MDW8430128.1 c-type cytochrome biogenesis protein CcmI [Sutterellaceae bacterium]
MIAFALCAVLALAAAVVWTLWPLWRRAPRAASVDRTQSNLAILRSQLADLESERQRGALAPAEYEEAKAELQRRALEEMEAPAAPAAASVGHRTLAAALSAVLPAAAVALYLLFGEPAALDPQAHATVARPAQPTPQDIEAMVARLAQRLQNEPDNLEGWAMLARSYVLLQRYEEAVQAYEHLAQRLPNEPGVLADYADALAMRAGRRVSGRALELVQQALAIDPNHPKALAMAGSAAFDRKDYAAAVQYWERLRALLPRDSEFARTVEVSIAEARAAGGLAPATPQKTPAAASVQGTVQLAPALQGKAAPTDTVFVFARAPDGAGAPLAILKLQVKDLPAPFLLDDTLAMTPQRTLSRFDTVTVLARVSKSGRAEAASGDLEGSVTAVRVGARDVVVTIDRVLP